MKKIILFFSLLLVFSFGLFFVGSTTVKATDVNDGKTVSTVGASIRTTDPAGLRFEGEVSEAFEGTVVSYGFVLTKGTVTKSVLLERLAASTAITQDAGDLVGNKFYVSITDIPAMGYDTNITALAYVDVDGNKTYADEAVTRNIQYIATHEVEDNSNANAFINRIYNTSTFNLNGGAFVSAVTGVVGAYNSGGGGDVGLTLAAKGVAASNFYWYRVCLKRTVYNNIYEVTGTYPGDATVTNANISVDYDYLLSGHSNTVGAVAKATSIGSYDYVYISALADGAIIRADNNIEMLKGNRLYLESGQTLPAASKDYYTFNGWYDNDLFTGDPITTQASTSNLTYYAKYTPVNYTLTYDLQDGLVDSNPSLASETFTVESGTITLPAAGRMSRENYDFVEWNTRSDGSGNTMTSLSAGSHESITVYAIWAPLAPVEVSLSSFDTAAIAALNPNYYVSSDFVAGKFNIGGNTYTVGTELFSTLSAAISAASSGQKIYLFAGTYTEDIITLRKSITIAGPNYGIHANVSATTLSSDLASGSRSAEAEIADSRFNCSAGFTFDGVKFTGTTCFNYYGTGLKIRNCVSTAVGRKLYSNSEVICLGGDTTNVNIQYNHFTFTGSTRPIRSEYTATNYVFSNNYCKSTSDVVDMMRFKTFAGTCEFSGNYAEVLCSNWLFYNFTSIADATINIKDNHLKGLGTNYSGLSFAGFNDSTVLNIVGNKIEDITGTVLKITSDSYNPTINIKYNQFIGNAKVNITSSSTNLSACYNYSDVAYNNVGTFSMSSDNDFASISALEAAYAASVTEDKDTDYNVTTVDKTVLEAVKPDIIVLKTANANDGRYVLKNGDAILTGYGETKYQFGTSAFASLDHALTYLSVNNLTNKKIYVFAGAYSENIKINKNNTTIYGPNYNVDGAASRSSEAIITGTVLVGSHNEGSTINGLKFTNNSQVKPVVLSDADALTYNIKEFTFAYNYIDKGSSVSSFIDFSDGNRIYEKNISILHNYFTAPSITATDLVKFSNVENVTFDYNTAINIATNVLGAYDTTNGKGMGGDLLVRNNKFTNVTKSAVWMGYMSPLTKGSYVVDISYNILNNVGGSAAIDFETTNANDYYSSSSVHHNVFIEVWKCFWSDKLKSNTITFTENVVYTPTKASGYIVKSNKVNEVGYIVDCATNLYLSTNGNSVIVPDASRFNAQAANTTTSNYESKDAYLIANPEMAAYLDN